jgi:hypothetical protein
MEKFSQHCADAGLHHRSQTAMVLRRRLVSRRTRRSSNGLQKNNCNSLLLDGSFPSITSFFIVSSVTLALCSKEIKTAAANKFESVSINVQFKVTVCETDRSTAPRVRIDASQICSRLPFCVELEVHVVINPPSILNIHRGESCRSGS